MTPLVSVIVVNWNTRQLTTACIASIYEKNKQTPFEIIVVDNGSTDNSLPWLQQQYTRVRFLANTSNAGFARANNQAIKEAKGEILLLLNSDTVLTTPEPLQILVDYFAAHQDTAVLGAKLLFPDGRVQSLGRDFITLKKCIQIQLFFSSAAIWRKRQKNGAPLEVDYVDGAFLAIRKEVVHKVGMLDESFFMYAEDMEWCARIRKAGHRIVILPGIEVIHHQAASSRQQFARMLGESAMNVSRFIYQQEGPRRAKAAYIVHLAGMALRIPLSCLRKPDLTGAYWQGFREGVGRLGHLQSIFQEMP